MLFALFKKKKMCSELEDKNGWKLVTHRANVKLNKSWGGRGSEQWVQGLIARPPHRSNH